MIIPGINTLKMKKLIPVIFVLLIFSSCKKSVSDFAWDKSFGKGEAFFIRATSDSGFVTGGRILGNPYLLKFNKKKLISFNYNSATSGLYNSVWFDTSGYIAAGSSDGKMLVTRISKSGNKIWEKTFTGGSAISFTNLYYTGNGKLLGIGTASPDSTSLGTTSILFVRFDTTGIVSIEKKTQETVFVSATAGYVDNSGNIYLPLTKKTTVSLPKASVAMYNNEFAKLWETELYNNSEFGAAGFSLTSGNTGNLFVCGNTEVSGKDGKLKNSFVVSLTRTGAVSWKKYPEISNTGMMLRLSEGNEVALINKNCYIINKLNVADGSDAGSVKIFSMCVSSATDSFGYSFDFDFEKNILVAGSVADNFYVAVKSVK